MPRPVNTPPTNREAEIFLNAVALPVEERPAFLDAACGDDSALRARVVQLLASHEASGFMPGPVAPPAGGGHPPPAPPPESPGDRLGNYKLVEQLGEGAFGTVWLAEQEQPVQRQVALKILKPDMDTQEVIGRFGQERQALAVMDHPNIAKVFDAGTTPQGRPFFVMELVRGKRITDYCDEAKLPTRERLELFIQVCQAVQHAHQKGIIHRDIKPSNILVTLRDGVAVPKVIDFGVAKAMRGRETEKAIVAEFEQMIGTALYITTDCDQIIGTPLNMSPEQARGEQDIDTRSDIYSLGVLLYELLTGRTPFTREDLLKAGYKEMRRLICEAEPKKPSTAVQTMERQTATAVAGRRQSEPSKLVRLIHGDLDWIVMKALEKDRMSRYETANGFASDIQRHINRQPVFARPATVGYRLRRLVRRNRFAFAAGVAVAAALIVGLGLSITLFLREKDALGEVRVAERKATTALADLSSTAPAFAEQAHDLAARGRFDEAIAKLDYAIRLQPQVAGHVAAKAGLLMCQMRLAKASEAFRAAERVAPGEPRYKELGAMCDRMGEAQRINEGKLSRESLLELFAILQRQQRPAAELLPVARLLGDANALLRQVFLERLKDLPLPPEKPLAERLTIRDDGLVALDLSRTKIATLASLRAVPLGILNCDGCTELSDLSPLENAPLKELRLARTKVRDLGPVATLVDLESLSLAETAVDNVHALLGLKLRSLDIASTAVSDLAPLRQAPLEALNISGTRVTTLVPLQGMRLRIFEAGGIPAPDVALLKGMPLEMCALENTLVDSLSFLRGMPLRELYLDHRSGANHDYAALSELPALEVLVLPAGYRKRPERELDAIAMLRSHPRLRCLSSNAGEKGTERIQSVERFWKNWDLEWKHIHPLFRRDVTFTKEDLPDGTWRVSISDRKDADLTCLAGAPISEMAITDPNFDDLRQISGLKLRMLKVQSRKLQDLAPLAGMPLRDLYLDECAGVKNLEALASLRLEKLSLFRTQVEDLKPLRNLPLEGLSLDETPVSDLSPLHSLPLRQLSMVSSRVVDIEALRGMPLDGLGISKTRIRDLSPLAGAPLKLVVAYCCHEITDVSPLAACKQLEQILLPSRAQNVEGLRGLPKLRFISFEWSGVTGRPSQTAEDFWKVPQPISAEALAREGEYRAASASLHQRLQAGGSFEKWKDELRFGTTLLASGDLEAYRSFCQGLQARQSQRGGGFSIIEGRICLLGPDCGLSAVQLEEGARHWRRDAEDEGTLLALGLWQFRAGNMAEAANTLPKVTGTSAHAAAADAVQAMVYWHLGEKNAALATLARARKRVADEWFGVPGDQVYWQDWLGAHLLVQEAGKVMGRQ
jgi:eukaryotic-like serine/threonine-protein kinase